MLTVLMRTLIGYQLAAGYAFTVAYISIFSQIDSDHPYSYFQNRIF